MADNKKRSYVVSFAPIRTEKSYKASGASVGFINQGTVNAYVNGLQLIPGSSFFPFDANNADDWDDTDYNITFNDGLTGALLYIVRKSYK